MSSRFTVDSLKTILEQLHNPEMLEAHPWASSAFVREVVAQSQELQSASPGKQLASAVEAIFSRTIPGVPPRRGKRLDTNWGEFGILAAQYFAPLRFGTPTPNSLRDAWGRIDNSILLYVFGRADGSLTPQQIQTYKLVGDETDVAPNSTLSDWHRKGMQQLADAIQTRENYLESAAARPGQVRNPANGALTSSPTHQYARVAWRVLPIFILALFLWIGVKAWSMYHEAVNLYDDASQARDLARSGLSIDTLQQAGPMLTKVRHDFQSLHADARPFLWLGPIFRWVPVYGNDLASAGDLMTMADAMLSAADTSYQAVSPLLDVINQTQSQSGFDASRFAEVLTQAQPQLLEAQKSVDTAVAARNRIDVDHLSPRLRDVMVNYVDKGLPWMQDGLMVAIQFPQLVGASSEGPKTYLLLAQNEDELRPTGGFVTAAATLLMQDGKIGSLAFDDSGKLDNWTKAYPSAPWQLRQYMNSPVLVLRDANWFTNYPTAALYEEDLYSYTHNHSVDGVISFDQHLLIEILRVVGPIEVEGGWEPITADNVVDYMRASKVPPGGQNNPNNVSWDNKAFINKITSALLHKILSGSFQWEKMLPVVIQALDEHHILLQFDDPAVTAVLVRRGWDGAIRPGSGDFLMVVDSNVGFNKTNSVVNASLTYDVDLSDSSAPSSRLSVSHHNDAAPVDCVPEWFWDFSNPDQQKYWESDYPIDRCYWDYLRVYTVPGTEVLQGNPQSIPTDWMVSKQAVPPQVDVLDEEISGVQGFGLLKVVPGGQTVETDLRFALPASILDRQSNPSVWSYSLRVQKQPGTIAVPIAIRVRLPKGAVVKSMPDGATVENGVVVIETNLRLDLNLTIQFTAP